MNGKKYIIKNTWDVVIEIRTWVSGTVKKSQEII